MIKTIPVLRGFASTIAANPGENTSSIVILSAQGIKFPEVTTERLGLVKGDKISFGPVFDSNEQPTGEFAIYKDNIKGAVQVNADGKFLTTNTTLKNSLMSHVGQTFVKGTDFLFDVSEKKVDQDSQTPYVNITFKTTKAGRKEKAVVAKPVSVAFGGNGNSNGDSNTAVLEGATADSTQNHPFD